MELAQYGGHALVEAYSQGGFGKLYKSAENSRKGLLYRPSEVSWKEHKLSLFRCEIKRVIRPQRSRHLS